MKNDLREIWVTVTINGKELTRRLLLEISPSKHIVADGLRWHFYSKQRQKVDVLCWAIGAAIKSELGNIGDPAFAEYADCASNSNDRRCRECPPWRDHSIEPEEIYTGVDTPRDTKEMRNRAITLHELKTWPEYFQAVVDNEKTFEIRKNDRNYKVGDVLILEEYDPDKQQYTGKSEYMQVTYILDKRPFVPDGYVCMAIVPI